MHFSIDVFGTQFRFTFLSRRDLTAQHWQMIGNKMSADLDMSIGRAAMAFTGETPWHRDGTRLDASASLDVWAQAAGMTWQALSSPVQFKTASGGMGTYGDKQVIYRSDTGAPLSVMGDGYKIVQPMECLEFFRDLIAAQGFKMHTAGVLNGGRKFWALATTPNGGEIVKGDGVRQFLTVCTSLDGSAATTVDFTNIRIVCANTFAMHRQEKKSAGAVKVYHSADFDAKAAKAQLGLAGDTWAAFQESARKMADTGCSVEQARDILRALFGEPKKQAAPVVVKLESEAPRVQVPQGAGRSFAELMAAPLAALPSDAELQIEGRDTLAGIIAATEGREQKSVARCLELFAGAGRGADHKGVKGTRWGLFNAVTEHVDHEQGRDATRLQAAWFGRGAGFKDEAFKLLTA